MEEKVVGLSIVNYLTYEIEAASLRARGDTGVEQETSEAALFFLLSFNEWNVSK